jgi:hypothetical protein
MSCRHQPSPRFDPRLRRDYYLLGFTSIRRTATSQKHGVIATTTFLFDCSGGQNTCLGQIGADMTVSLTSDSLSPVPELSTWTMMAVGFVGLGFVGYRRGKPLSFA